MNDFLELVFFLWMIFSLLLLIHIAAEVEKISASLGRILEHLEKLSSGSEKPSGGIGGGESGGLQRQGEQAR
jgi:hypothetical protein